MPDLPTPTPQLPDLFPGMKTYVAAALAALVAVNSVLHFMPEQMQTTLLAIAAALGLYGIRQAIERLK